MKQYIHNIWLVCLGSVFSLPHELAKLFIAEEEVIKLFNSSNIQFEQTYAASLQSRFDEVSYDTSLSDVEYFEEVLEKLVGNPVHVYNLLERLLTWPQHMENLLPEEKRDQLDDILINVMMPDEADLEGAVQALVRIQFAYR